MVVKGKLVAGEGSELGDQDLVSVTKAELWSQVNSLRTENRRLSNDIASLEAKASKDGKRWRPTDSWGMAEVCVSEERGN